MADFDDDGFEITEDILTQLNDIEISLLNNSFQLSSEDEDDYQILPTKKKRRRIIQSDSEISEHEAVGPDTSGSTPSTNVWTEPKGNQRKIIPFTEISGVPLHVKLSMSNMSPVDFYSLFVTDDILQQIVNHTNCYAIAKITNMPEATPSARIRKWHPTNLTEMKQFFGLILFMGLVKLVKLADYWSKDKITGHPFSRTVMSRNRFELLLQMLHFSDNDDHNKEDRLHRVRQLIENLNANFKKNYTPTEDICIDESMVPFRGRIIFRQYNKQKRHKYGIKEFKLCTIPGYTYKVSIYAGKNDETNNTPTNVVMSLCGDLLNKGHTLYTDNWYTSVDLARQLIDQETHLVGTIRKNRRQLPKDVVTAKLRKGDFAAAESFDGITMMKWKDKRDVYVLSTKHSIQFHDINKRGKIVSKPKIVVDYNKVKGAVDLADQLAAYSTPLRKSLKWHKKLAINLLLNTTLVNAYILYQKVTNKKIPISNFRKSIVESFCMQTNIQEIQDERPKRLKHKLVKKEGKSSIVRRSCSQCYKNIVQSQGRKQAKNKVKKVQTFCDDCPNKPFLCLDCFNKAHRFA
ncbi:piggyBac transposable element-derived protein 4-like [Maniola jurtina]|uniref:piggyBac transposable element-derived protein 4-like n=1 Tax=Maniola jurtina TaxID=191418 RepID=UPI001E68C229|nr:piggyBac transposable element-derived protein 4-like [Maniola jurtina]XP_045781867.1 piggyBac transposable element-derived protein 4-like [Maniola jurtina]